MIEQTLIKAFKASEDLKPNTVVKFNDDGTVSTAKSETDKIAGVVHPAGNSFKKDEYQSIVIMGIINVVAGADLKAGDGVGVDANGNAIVGKSLGKSMYPAKKGDMAHVLVNIQASGAA